MVPPAAVTDQPPLLSIGDLARAAQTTPRAIRYYEELGLLSPARRTPRGMRRYTPHEVARLQAIKALQECDCTLAEITELVTARYQSSAGSDAGDRIRRLFVRKLGEINTKVERFQALKTDLAHSIEALTDCCVCALVPTADTCQTCQLDTPAKRAALPKTFEATL